MTLVHILNPRATKPGRWKSATRIKLRGDPSAHKPADSGRSVGKNATPVGADLSAMEAQPPLVFRHPVVFMSPSRASSLLQDFGVRGPRPFSTPGTALPGRRPVPGGWHPAPARYWR